MRELIQQCRVKFGPSPRKFEWWQVGQSVGFWPIREWAKQYRYYFPDPPAWCVDDPLIQLFQDRKKLLQNGRVVWAHLLQANSLLFNPGFGDSPASIVYGLDAAWDDETDLLQTIAHKLHGLKGSVPDEPQLRPIAAHLTSEMDRSMKMLVPDPICRGRELVATSIMVHRKHLPSGYLTGGLLPLIINPRETACTMILPSRFWPPALLDR